MREIFPSTYIFVAAPGAGHKNVELFPRAFKPLQTLAQLYYCTDHYSRSADLGNGLVIYPVLAIGGALFSRAATVSIRSATHKRTLAIAVYVSAFLAVAGLLLTLKAAPNILSLRTVQNKDVAHLQQLFNTFWFWETKRASFRPWLLLEIYGH